MESYIPDELREENYKLAQLYIESEDKTIEEIIEEHASAAFKRFFYAEKNRAERLRKRGIIEN